MKEKKHITIIGGGMGGLALGQALLKYSDLLTFTIYERDESPSYRSQGYQISVHDYGVKALESLELNGFNELMKENPIEGIMILRNNDLIPYVKLPKADGSLVNRFKLRDLLLQNLLLSSLSFTLPFFYIVGFNHVGNATEKFFWYWLFIFMFQATMCFIGEFYVALTPNEATTQGTFAICLDFLASSNHFPISSFVVCFFPCSIGWFNKYNSWIVLWFSHC
jgi:hypothetical protein